MSNILKLETLPERPEQLALRDAIDNAITDTANSFAITPNDVLGVLSAVSMSINEIYLSEKG